MKVKTSLTLSEDVLKRIDERAEGNRSEWIERVVREQLRKLERDEIGRRDMEIYNRLAEELSDRLPDILEDQIDLDELDIDHDAERLEMGGGADAAR
jgi:metal-responsive CopG/Arc/MetJ family transcriptional regulator